LRSSSRTEKKPDFYVFLDVTAWKGQAATLRGPAAVIAAIESGDEIKTSVPVYAESVAAAVSLHVDARAAE
jgi:hypothetical protein